MILIVGLGNPGPKYANNRHNVGHLFVDYLIKPTSPFGLRGSSGLKIVKTDCFMNVSGVFVKKLVSRYSLFTRRSLGEGGIPNRLIVLHDDLDIPLGKFHIQFASGPQLHNGLESVEQHLKTKDFWRVRIGVDNRLPKNEYLTDGRGQDNKTPWIDGITYSLQNFLPDEKKLLETEIFPKIFSQLKLHLKNQFKIII